MLPVTLHASINLTTPSCRTYHCQRGPNQWWPQQPLTLFSLPRQVSNYNTDPVKDSDPHCQTLQSLTDPCCAARAAFVHAKVGTVLSIAT